MTRWAALVLVVALATGCGGPDGASPEPGSTGVVENDLFRISLQVAPETPRPAEALRMRLELTPKGEMTLEFRTSQRYDFEVLTKGGERVWQWSHGMAFLQVLGERRLGSGERLAYEEAWTPERPGSYVVRGTISADRPDLAVEAGIEVAG